MQHGIVPRARAGREPGVHPALGHPLGRREEGLRAPDGGLRDPGGAAPTTRSAGWSRPSRSWANSTTPCSSTSRATTAAPRSARSTASSWSGRPSTGRPRTSPTCAPAGRVRGRGLLPELLGRLGGGRRDPRDLVHPDGPRRGQHGRHGRALAAGHRAKGELRRQYAHLIDVVPTILEAVGSARAEGRRRPRADPDRRASACATPSTTRRPRSAT